MQAGEQLGSTIHIHITLATSLRLAERAELAAHTTGQEPLHSAMRESAEWTDEVRALCTLLHGGQDSNTSSEEGDTVLQHQYYSHAQP